MWKTPAKERYELTCLQCGDTFKSFSEEGPVRCPRCQSSSWSEEGKPKIGRPKKDQEE
jgi:predicted Zn-ribbon and HTH transcriptional regulator